jgi:hypothetical protein
VGRTQRLPRPIGPERAKELDLLAPAFATEDRREGMAACVAKRALKFRGR